MPASDGSLTSRPMVLIAGMPRSGTTWLGKIFDSHPRTLYRHEPDSVLRNHALPMFIPPERFEQHGTEMVRWVERLLSVKTAKTSGKTPLFHNSPLKKSRPSDSVTRAWFESGTSSWRWDDKGIDRWT